MKLTPNSYAKTYPIAAKIFALIAFCFLVGAASAQDQVLPQQGFKRVIALAPNLVEMIYALEAQDRLVGVTEHSNFPKAAQQKPIVGNYAQLNIERVLQLKPDLIIAWQGGSPEQDVTRLKQLGLHVVWVKTNQYEDVADTLRQLGNLLVAQQQGERLAQAFMLKLTQLRQTYSHKTAISVFYELWPQPLTTVGKESWPQQALTLCGAKNIAEQAQGQYPHVSLEHVIAAKPQVIIQPLDSARGIALTDWQRWPEIPAIQHQAILTPDSDQLHRMTPRALDEAEQLCLHLDDIRRRYQM